MIEADPRWEWRRAAQDYEHQHGEWPARITLPVEEYQEALARGYITFAGKINWLDDSPPTIAQPGEAATSSPKLNREQRRAQERAARRNRIIETNGHLKP